MSQKRSQSLLKELENLNLVCPICMQVYNNSDNCPLVLSCGHSICDSCYKIINKRFCPLCKLEFYAQPNKNFSLLEILDNSEKQFNESQNQKNKEKKDKENIKDTVQLETGEYYNQLGEFIQKQGNYTEAIEYFKKAIQIDYNIEAFSNLIKFAAPNYANMDLLTFWKSLVEKDQHSIAYVGLGWSYYDKENKIAAMENFLKALEIDKQCARAYNALGIVYDDMNDFDKAIENFKKSIECDIKMSGAYNNIGNLYLNKNDYSNAKEYFMKSIEANPKLAVGYYNLGRLYFYHEDEMCIVDGVSKEKLWENALKQLYIAEEKDPRHSYIQVFIARFLKKQGKNKLMITYLNKALEFDNKNTDALSDLSEYYKSIENNDSAIHYQLLAVEVNPKSSDMLNSLAILYKAKNDFLKAKEYYLKSIEADPKSYYPYYNLGCLYKSKELYQEAVEQFKFCAELVENDYNIVSNIATCYENMKEYDKALKYCESAFKIDGTKGETHYTRVLCYIGLNDINNAEKYLLLLKDNEDYKIQYSIFSGVVNETREDLDKAIYFYTMALDYNPGNEFCTQKVISLTERREEKMKTNKNDLIIVDNQNKKQLSIEKKSNSCCAIF